MGQGIDGVKSSATGAALLRTTPVGEGAKQLSGLVAIRRSVIVRTARLHTAYSNQSNWQAQGTPPTTGRRRATERYVATARERRQAARTLALTLAAYLPADQTNPVANSEVA